MSDLLIPLIDGSFLMERMAGKGGWTYIVLPPVPRTSWGPFGWLKVRGSIDKIPLEHYKLMPMKDGRLFLPVKAQLRKQLKKEAGDTVHVTLYINDLTYEIPEELIDCLTVEPTALKRFNEQSESEQKRLVEWIYEAKSEETKVRRIAQLIDMMQ